MPEHLTLKTTKDKLVLFLDTLIQVSNINKRASQTPVRVSFIKPNTLHIYTAERAGKDFVAYKDSIIDINEYFDCPTFDNMWAFVCLDTKVFKTKLMVFEEQDVIELKFIINTHYLHASKMVAKNETGMIVNHVFADRNELMEMALEKVNQKFKIASLFSFDINDNMLQKIQKMIAIKGEENDKMLDVIKLEISSNVLSLSDTNWSFDITNINYSDGFYFFKKYIIANLKKETTIYVRKNFISIIENNNTRSLYVLENDHGNRK